MLGSCLHLTTKAVLLNFWLNYIAPFHDMDELVTKVPDPLQIELLLRFAHRVRWGHYGDGTKVSTGSVQVALCAIGKTFELAGL